MLIDDLVMMEGHWNGRSYVSPWSLRNVLKFFIKAGEDPNTVRLTYEIWLVSSPGHLFCPDWRYSWEELMVPNGQFSF